MPLSSEAHIAMAVSQRQLGVWFCLPVIIFGGPPHFLEPRHGGAGAVRITTVVPISDSWFLGGFVRIL